MYTLLLDVVDHFGRPISIPPPAAVALHCLNCVFSRTITFSSIPVEMS